MLDQSSQSERYSTGVGSWIFCWTWEAFTGFGWIFQSESRFWFQSNNEV